MTQLIRLVLTNFWLTDSSSIEIDGSETESLNDGNAVNEVETGDNEDSCDNSSEYFSGFIFGVSNCLQNNSSCLIGS